LALVGYNLLKVDDGPVDALIRQLYTDVLGDYWDAERRHVDAAYASIPFPLEEIPFPDMSMHYTWTRDHLIGYLGTWSALQHFQKQRGYSPLDEAFLRNLENAWPDALRQNVHFPIFARVGRFSAAV
jgi:hypothetical protein